MNVNKSAEHVRGSSKSVNNSSKREYRWAENVNRSPKRLYNSSKSVNGLAERVYNSSEHVNKWAEGLHNCSEHVHRSAETWQVRARNQFRATTKSDWMTGAYDSNRHSYQCSGRVERASLFGAPSITAARSIGKSASRARLAKEQRSCRDRPGLARTVARTWIRNP